MTPPTAGRAYPAVLLLLGAGGVLLLVGFGLPWGSGQVPMLPDAGGAARAVTATGQDIFPGAAMCGWVALAAVVGIVATRSWGRTAIAAIAAGAGLVAAIAAVAFAAGPVDRVSAALSGSEVSGVSTTLAWLLALLGSAAVATAGSVTMVRGRQWPSLGSRYERPPSGSSGPGSGAAGSDSRGLSAWQAQDAGQDPTDDLVE